MSRSPRKSRRALGSVAVAGLAALVLGACGSQDADRDDVVNAVEEAGGSTQVANCIGNAFEDTFEQDQLNDLANADTPEDFPEDALGDGTTIADKATSIMDACWESDGESSGLEDESSEGESTESTTSTTAAAG